MHTQKPSRILILLIASISLASCMPTDTGKKNTNDKPAILVTYSILHSLISDWLDPDFDVELLMPNGADPHDWSPSAADFDKINKAKVIIANGLGLEGNIVESLKQAKEKGVEVIELTDYFEPRRVKAGQGIPGNDPDQAEGARDPHLWTDPYLLSEIITKMSPLVEKSLGANLSEKTAKTVAKLTHIDTEIAGVFSKIPAAKKRFITGHESLGYFADRYHLKVLGAIVPSLSSQAEVSPSELSDLKTIATENEVKTLFTEIGTPMKVAQALANEVGIKTVEVDTHKMPEGTDFYSYMKYLATTISENL